MNFSDLFKASQPRPLDEATLDGVTSDSFVVLGGKGAGRSTLVRRLVAHAEHDRQRIVALTSADMAISPRAAIVRHLSDSFDPTHAIHEINVSPDAGPSIGLFVEVAVRECVEGALSGMGANDDVTLLLVDTAGYLTPALSIELAHYFGRRSLKIWLVQTGAYDFRKNPLLEPVLDTRTRIAMPMSHAWTADYAALLHPSTRNLTARARYEPCTFVDVAVERSWDGELFRLPLSPPAVVPPPLLFTAGETDPRATESPTGETAREAR